MPGMTAGTSSRYAGTNGVPDNQNSVQSSMGSSAGSTNTQGTVTGTTSQTQNGTSKSTTTNLAGADKAALDQLIQQLLAGGTPEMREQIAARKSEAGNVANIRNGYSKEAAFTDAQGLVSQQMRRTLEQLLPSINRAAEDAGSSGGALRALLLQDAAAKAAESSSALGVQTATAYGGVSASLSQTLEGLTRTDPTVANALINALGIAKGATSTTSGSTSMSSTGTSSQQSSQSQQTSQQDSKQINTNYSPLTVTPVAPTSIGGNSFGQYGGGTPDMSKFIGSTADTLAQLSGGGSPWNAYAF